MDGLDHMNILICTYTYPPMEGIGGRRWAKFYKGLKALGHQVFVIHQKPPDDARSPWLKDVGLDSSNFVSFDFGYPELMNLAKYGFIDKVKYRLVLRSLKIKYAGNYYDRSCLFRLKDHPWISDLIQNEKIDWLIASGGPFSWMSELADLKMEHPALKLLADFRDPWVNNKSSFGYADLPKERIEHERKLERKVIESYNLVSSVHRDMNDYFIQTYEQPSNKLFELTNAWDRDELVNSTFENENEEKSVVFSGTLYDGTESSFLNFLNGIRSEEVYLKLKNERIFFDFYGSVPSWFHKHVMPDDLVRFHGRVNLEEINEKLASATGSMLFLTSDMTFSLSTKFFEYIKYGLPILVFSNQGKTSRFVEEQSIGLGISEGVDPAKWNELIQMVTKGRMKPPEWIEEYELKQRTKSLLKALSLN